MKAFQHNTHHCQNVITNHIKKLCRRFDFDIMIYVLGVKIITGNKERQLVIMDIKQHRLYYFDYKGIHVTKNAINLEFYDGPKHIFQIKILLKDYGTVFKLSEKLENGSFFQHDSKEVPDYWIKPMFGLEVNQNSLVIIDIIDPAIEQHKLFTVNTNEFGYFNKLKLLCNFPENDYTAWTITAFPLVLENGKEIIFDPNRNRNYKQAVEYCNSRDTQIVLPESSDEKRSIIDVLKEAWDIGPSRTRVKNSYLWDLNLTYHLDPD